ncbi:MAG: DUF4395 domain-containing protein [Sulfurovum sp.]|nr:MAG: DUF4395 domain-containing protein [Sulfurovum sp.]RUM70999.1 MAG: DUF4395 domain-containing protein [Sulfurovum sp.]
MKKFFTYGETVEGYDVPVLNEREARAGAGILFTIGLLSLMNAVMLGHGIVTRYFISFFTLDFLIRVINPAYSPSLLLGRVFVQNQKPEYVGAAQKRFAWGLGLLLALPMFYLLVIHWQPNPIKVFVCILCLILLIMESAFSICLGCKIYNLIMPQKATHCPGGVCEIQTKDPIQTFNKTQKIIVFTVLIVFGYGLYMYATKIENKTMFTKKISVMLMSAEELKAIEEAKAAKEFEEF